jgi:hypothetical protein
MDASAGAELDAHVTGYSEVCQAGIIRLTCVSSHDNPVDNNQVDPPGL